MKKRKEINSNVPTLRNHRNFSDVKDDVNIEFDNYFLGGRSISGKRIANLLISSSFGANAILYAAWLGYVMGIWAIIIQIAWSLSFILLYRYAKTIYGFTSLHDFLGFKYGRLVHKISAWCSIIGLVYFAGWEISIAKSGLESLAYGNPLLWSILTILFILIAIVYTTFGGQKVNSIVNSFVNILKYLLLIFVVASLVIVLGTKGELNSNLIIPSFDVGMAGLGMLGLITNLVFNLSWQFVDNSTWQSISSNSPSESKAFEKSLFGAGLGIFLTVNLFGIITGALLKGVPNITSDNILGMISVIMPGIWSSVVAIAIAGLLLLSMMSLIDGVSLSVAQSLIVDVGFNIKKEKQLNIKIARIVTALIGVLSAWGVQLFLKLLGGNIFDFVYILIVTEISLLGPVVIGLTYKVEKVKYMWIAIIIPILLGFISSSIGVVYKTSEFIDVAGTITALSSLVLAYIIYQVQKKTRKSIQNS